MEVVSAAVVVVVLFIVFGLPFFLIGAAFLIPDLDDIERWFSLGLGLAYGIPFYSWFFFFSN